MPLVQLKDLPDSARTWVFGANKTLDGPASETLLAEVDRFLSQWKAHGSPADGRPRLEVRPLPHGRGRSIDSRRIRLLDRRTLPVTKSAGAKAGSEPGNERSRFLPR